NNNTNTSTSIIDKVISYNIKKNNLQEYLTYNISKIIKRYESDILVDNILNSTKPYVISFIGINGVGKTTTLGKIITFLKSKIENLDIIVGGCDTFRSGAIEQLQLICDNKNVELYHRGYNKDDSKIVAETINYAKKKNIKNTNDNNIEKDKRNTVVLIDTAGRMHTKHHLMQSLGKIYENNIIDHTIFVSEALIGNEGINVVKEFSKVVKIDSLVITKIDTVGNKIGHIVNLTATVDVPVLFIGTGQSSKDIEEINVEWIVDRLVE
ncbi:Signal recognition particle receptor alpha subunit, partial [Spraguea lophii 42_110]